MRGGPRHVPTVAGGADASPLARERHHKPLAAARDWDLLLQHLAKTVGDADKTDVPTLDMLTGYALAHREQAQAALEQAARDCPPRALTQLQARVVAAVRWKRKSQPTLGDFARPRIHQQLRDLTTIADRDHDAWTMLHEVRIASKRLRYSLEVVDGCLRSPSTASGGRAAATPSPSGLPSGTALPCRPCLRLFDGPLRTRRYATAGQLIRQLAVESGFAPELVQQVARPMLTSPTPAVFPVQHASGHSEKIHHVIEILAAGPAKLLNHHVLSRGNPRLARTL